jgi:CheY-like chemotaxis protein
VADLRATEGGTEVVLVAEDDEQVRATVIDMLNDLGYRVLRANDAISALAIVESGVHIDLLFTDVVMPGTMKSTELARKARERIPGIAVLFTSGYTENSIVHGGRLDAGVELLSKPYSREALARKIRRVLGNESVKRSHPLRTEPEREHKEASLRILYVEDDDLIRAVTVELLESFGHVVLEATDSNSALALLEKHDVDVLLTDIGLPDVPGDELALLARQRQPGLSVIFATGQNDAPPIDGVVLLRKPYDTASLAHALRRVVETS